MPLPLKSFAHKFRSEGHKDDFSRDVVYTFINDIFYSLYHHSYQYLCDCSYQFSLNIIHSHYLLMENQRSIQSANFDLVNTYFGIDVGHTYDGIDVTA